MTDLPSAPKKDQATLLVTSALQDLRKTERTQRRLLGRVNTLQLLGDIANPDGGLCKRSDRQWRDHPQIQLLLERRDRYQCMEEEIRGFKSAIEEFEHTADKSDAQAIVSAYGSLARLRTQQSAEMTAMEACLTNLRKEGTAHTGQLAKIVSDLAKLEQNWLMHKERLGGRSTDDLQDAELDA
jgi:hypothetical protein